MNQKECIERIATLLAELRAGVHGNLTELDTQDMNRLREIRAQVDNAMDEHDALTILRQQPWGERIPAGSQHDIDCPNFTHHLRIASYVTTIPRAKSSSSTSR
jgi:hypothetical protein